MRKNGASYRKLLRKLLAAVLSENPSESDISNLAEQLRHGQLPYELAEILERLVQTGGMFGSEIEDNDIGHLLFMVKNRGMKKEELINVMSALSGGHFRPSSRDPIIQIVTEFVAVAPENDLMKFREILESYRPGDEYLEGLSRGNR